MSWIALIGLIITLITKLPDLIAMVQKWLEIFRRVPKANRWRERGVFGKAIRSALRTHEEVANLRATGAVVEVKGVCPVAACVRALELAYPA